MLGHLGADNVYLLDGGIEARAECGGTFALLHEIYTGTVVTVFDGSPMGWSLQKDLPVISGVDSNPVQRRGNLGRE